MIYIGIDPSLESSAMFMFDSESCLYAYHSFFVTHDGKIGPKRTRVMKELSDCGVHIHTFIDLVDRMKVKNARAQSEINTKKQASAVCDAIRDILNSGAPIEDLDGVLDEAHDEDIKVYKMMAENDLCRFQTMKIVAGSMIDEITAFCSEHSCNEVVIAIEAPAYVATGSSSVDLIAGCAFVRDIPNVLKTIGMAVNNVYMLPPTSVKKHATGRGSATKEEMCEAFTRKGPDDAFRLLVSTVEAKDYKPMDDVVDAYFMVFFIAESILEQLR